MLSQTCTITLLSTVSALEQNLENLASQATQSFIRKNGLQYLLTDQYQ